MFKELVKAQLNRAESDEESISTLGSFGTVFSYKDAVLGIVGDGNTAIGKRGLPPRNNKTSMSNIRSNNNNNSSSSITKNMTEDYMDQLPNAMANLKSSYSVEVPPSIFKIKSDIENIGLNIRCGHAESKNDCKSMEDFVFLSPTFNNSGSTTEQDDELVDEDFAFCAVYDGHGGDYVSRYLKDNLYIRFCEQFEENSKCTDIDNGSSGPTSSGMDKLDLVRISFKEAACKIDREVLLKDSRELMKMSNFRNDALSDCCSESTRETEVMDDSSTVYNRQAARSAASSSECFAGSCAVVAILYHSKSTIPSVPNSSITNSLSPQIAPQNSSNSLTPSALKLHSNDSPVMTAMFRNNLLGSRTRNVRRISTMSSSEAGDDYLMPFDVDNDKSLNRGTSHQSLEILRAMKRRSSVHSMLSDLTADRSFFRAESFLRQDSFPRQDGSVNCDDSGYISVKLTPKQIQLLKSLGDDSSTILSNFEMDDIQELANDLKSRAGEFQKYADDYRNHADALFQVINEHESTCNRDGDNFPLRKMKSDDSDDISSLGNPESRSSSSRVSMTSRSSVSGGSVGSVGSITSLKSFGDGDMGGGRRGKNYPALSTVSEGINESRQTSFATTRIASQESYIATTSPGQAWSQSTCNAVDQLELSETKNFLFIAHVGDCRAVLCDKSVAILLTEDHTPTQQDEVTRIKASGGFVSKKRVNGMLAVSRAFGDIKYKSFDPNVAAPESFLDEELLSTGIWSRSNTVISMPDILELEIQPTYEFIILASDGIWNVFSCAEAVQFVRDHLSEHENAMAAAKALIDQATVEGATDNASAVVICLNQT